LTINKEALKHYSTQSLDQKDKESVLDVLGSGHLSRGPKINQFETELGLKCKNNNTIAVNSATSALQIAYQINDIKSGSLVWTSPITFVATANAALNLGAQIDFVDINPETLNICPKELEKKLRIAKEKNKVPDLIVLVHFGGNPCDMDKIYALSQKYGFNIVEDASHALGAIFSKEVIGNCKFSDGAIFSFHPVKMITTGEGGALLTKTEEAYRRARSLRSHGISEDRSNLEDKNMPEWFYEQVTQGYNFRLSDLQAALGLSQLKKLDSFIEIRNELAMEYSRLLEGLPFKLQRVADHCDSSYHLFVIQMNERDISRDFLYKYLKSNNIGCQVHYIPVHLHPFYRNKGFKMGDFPNAESYFSKCLSLPLHQGLTKNDIRFVCKFLEKFLDQADTPSVESNSASL
jgi:UDP-4-amino-4,6-dideoxy-N-acetyl-beta-L-altrosamine transaminase